MRIGVPEREEERVSRNEKGKEEEEDEEKVIKYQ